MGRNISEYERYMLERFLNEGRTVKDIAAILGRGRTTIYDEIKRGTVELLNTDLTMRRVYLADVAQRHADENKARKGRPLKIGNDYELAAYLDRKLGKEKYSAAAVYHDMMDKDLKFSVTLSVRTIYNYASNGVLAQKNYIRHYKRKNKRITKKVALNNITEKIIEKRPEKIKERRECGHWEMDTVVSGRGDKSCLLVLTERKSRKEIIRRMPDKTSASVVNALDQIEMKLGKDKFKDAFKTVTCDNGVEFWDAAGIEKGERTNVYYCHPYASYERGSNENANKLIRKWIPKGAHIGKFSEKFIQRVERWMNNYPRKILDWKTADEVFAAELGKNF